MLYRRTQERKVAIFTLPKEWTLDTLSPDRLSPLTGTPRSPLTTWAASLNLSQIKRGNTLEFILVLQPPSFSHFMPSVIIMGEIGTHATPNKSYREFPHLFLSLIAPSFASRSACSRFLTLSAVARKRFSSLGSSQRKSALSRTS